MKVVVFWHKNPDTDSILSAIIYTEFLNSIWFEAQAVKLWELNTETKFLLEVFWEQDLQLVNTLPAWTLVALVDHNEKTQTIDNIDELDIHSVVDHHKFWSFSTNKSIFVRTQPLCSTCSVLYNMFIQEWVSITQRIAKLMIAWIISDSLYFRSPTTTEIDKEIVESLNQIAQIPNLEDFSMQMFNAKSDLGDISIHDLIKLDYKEFDFNWIKMWIWTIETTNPSYSLNRKQEILKWLEEIKSQNWLDAILLSIVDILNEKNTTIVLGDKEQEIIKNVFWENTQDNIANLWNRISRKKQMVPQLDSYFKS